MAALEEFLQQKYVEYYDEVENYANKPELLGGKMKNLLLKDGSRNYITYNGNMYYLINKSGLPKEIQELLVGGDTTEYAKYIRLQDVYGITSDLKVYYCSNDGLNGNVLGNIETLEVNLKAKAELANKNEGLKEQLKRTLLNLGIDTGSNDLTVGDLNNIKDLTLDSTSGLTNLSGISEVNKLRNLVLKDLSLENLDGIEGCSLLESIYFDNCTLTTGEGYNKLTTVLGLKKLYFKFPNSRTAEDVKKQVVNFSNSLNKATELNKLEYFGVFGSYNYISNRTAFSFDSNTGKYGYHLDEHSNLNDISSFKNFATNIKSTIKYLYLNNNNLTDISCLNDFSNLYEVALVDNPNLASFLGLKNHSNLTYLISGYTGISDLEGLDGCKLIAGISLNNCSNLSSLSNLKSEKLNTLAANNCNLMNVDALSYCTNLTYINLENNPELNNISSIKSLSQLTSCYLGGNTNLDERVLSSLEFQNIIINCKTLYSLDSKYSLLFLNQPKLDLKDNKLTDEKLELLRGKTGIYGIRLTGNPDLTNDKIVEILGTLTNLEVVDLYGCSQVTSISFISKLTKLVHLDLRGTSVTNLSLLEDLATQNKLTIGCLMLDNSSIDLTTIQTAMNSISAKNKSSGYEFNGTDENRHLSSGMCLAGAGIVSKLANCTKLTSFVMYSDAHDWPYNSGTADFSNCTNLKTIKERWGYFKIITSDSVTFLGSETSVNHDISKCLHLQQYNHGYCSFDINPVISSLSRATGFTTLYINSNLGKNNANIILTPLASTIVNSITLQSCTSLETINLIQNINTLNTLKLCKCEKFDGNLNFINYMPNINDLNINSNPNLKSLSGLENKARLSKITADNCSINSLVPLLNDTGLVTCYFANNKISSLNGIQNLTSLQTLTLDNNSISDLYYLGLLADKGTIALKTLQLSNNNLENSTTISIDKDGDGQVENVYVDNIEIIKKLHDKGVTTIDVSKNNFSDTSELSKLSGVKY